jgi:uncharacterized membrane protein
MRGEGEPMDGSSAARQEPARHGTASGRRLIVATVVLGVGLGAFLDGIVLHQILQWHNMLSSKYPPTSVVNLEVNMFWDGVFHAFAWTVTLVGVVLLWNAACTGTQPYSAATLTGGLLLGWGAFNLIEGMINHQILGLHHVRETTDHHDWDIGFLALSAALCVSGWLLIRRDSARRTG